MTSRTQKIGLQDKAADDLNQLWRMQSNPDGLSLFNVGQGYVLDFALDSKIQTIGDKKPGLWDAEGTNANQRLYLTADDKLYAVYNNTPYYLCSSTSNYKTTDASAASAVTTSRVPRWTPCSTRCSIARASEGAMMLPPGGAATMPLPARELGSAV